jgi:K+/H+ antiporter YhaU regulatory subunit KhtT
MTEDQERILAIFEVRIHDLMNICDKQKRRIDDLVCSLDSKDKELRQSVQTIEELKAKCDSMLTARIVSYNEKEIKSAKMRLSGLVREVDKCIALLE